MADPVSAIGSALQATLTSDLLKTLTAALASGSVTDAPPSVTNTQTSLSISGTLSSQLENGGGAVVQTAAGPITLSFANPVQQPLPQGTLTLLIQPGNPPTASVVAQQAVTPQAQIQTQATAAQQTQDVQTQPLQALPPITVGQVLTALPLPAAVTTNPVQVAPPVVQPAPVVGQAASSAAISAAITVELPIAVMLNSAIPPAPTAPSATFVTAQPFVVDAVEPTPEEEAVSLQGQQPQAQQMQTRQTQNAALEQASSEIDSDLDAEEISNSPTNILAAQESVNDTAPPPHIAAPIAYNPGVTVPASPQQQDFLVLKVGSTSDNSALQPVPSYVNQSQGQMMTATVIAQTSSGQPLLEMSDGGAVLVNQRVSSPIGTELTLQRLTPDEAQDAAAASPGPQVQGNAVPPLSDVPLSIARQQPWPALTQLMTVLAAASPAAASFIRQAIPALGPGFAQAFTAFVTHGDSAATTYPPADGTLAIPLTGNAHAAGIQDLKAALLQIGTDFTASATKANPAAQPQSWQTYQVPVLTDYGITMAQLFVRQQADIVDDEPVKQKPASTRFLLEISPSQLGPVQLDGLLRKTTTRVDRLDLIVRTAFAVPPDAAGQMTAMFQSTLGATGMAGNLGFQIGAENFVLPTSDENTHYRSGI